MNPVTLQILSLCLGSGVLVILLRVSFQFGGYVKEVERIAALLAKTVDKVEAVDKNVTIMMATNKTHQQTMEARTH